MQLTTPTAATIAEIRSMNYQRNVVKTNLRFNTEEGQLKFINKNVQRPLAPSVVFIISIPIVEPNKE